MCVGAGLELNSAGLRPPGTEFDTPGLYCTALTFTTYQACYEFKGYFKQEQNNVVFLNTTIVRLNFHNTTKYDLK